MQLSPYATCGANKTYIYVLESLNNSRIPVPVTKVGRSTNPYKRREQLERGCPYKLNVKATYQIDSEAEAQRIEMLFRWNYSASRLNGEWFEMTAEDVVWHLENVFGLQAQ